MDKDSNPRGINHAALTVSVLLNGLLIGYLAHDYKEMFMPQRPAVAFAASEPDAQPVPSISSLRIVTAPTSTPGNR